MRRASSRALSRWRGTCPSSSTTNACSDDPPRGARRRLARPSKRTSARCTDRPASTRVLRETAPTARPPCASSRARCTGAIRQSRRSVRPGSCQTTASSGSSTEARSVLRTDGAPQAPPDPPLGQMGRQSCHGGPRAGEAEILAGAGCSGQGRPARQVGGAQLSDIALVKVI